jgi:hypothetical protein
MPWIPLITQHSTSKDCDYKMRLSSLIITFATTTTLTMGTHINTWDDSKTYDLVILAPTAGWTALMVTQQLPTALMVGTTIENDPAKVVTADGVSDEDRRRVAGVIRFTGVGPETREFRIDDENSGIHAAVSFDLDFCALRRSADTYSLVQGCVSPGPSKPFVLFYGCRSTTG